ncbi:MAG: DUF445 domain-containing protein [Aeromicrobium sp.]|uniref:DUF445 domain-containing protein n=1 Tax=Aeromicrobium sp. TaxID=1871063 RepID=UPI0039E6196C
MPDSFALSPELSAKDAERRRALRRMRIVATSLLALAAVIFVFTRDGEGWVGYVNAASEAAMVGAIADWFAVTALFKHPLGLPIPHTAIIPKRKESLGESLQDFVADNFLQPDIVRDRLSALSVARHGGEWLLEGEHADQLVRAGSRITAHALDRISDDDVAALVREVAVPKLMTEPLGPAAGQMLGEIVADGAHTGVVDLVIDELHRWLGKNGEEVMLLVEERAPSWTPHWLDRKVAERLHLEARRWVADVRRDPTHRARSALDRWLAQLAHDLQFDAETRDRAERLKERMLSQPQVVATAISLWTSFKGVLTEALTDESGLLRRRAVEEVRALGQRLLDDEALAARVDELAADVASYTVERHGGDLATVISATVSRWDGVETAQRIELHVGRDLQFIRINGTVVGGLAGLWIHAVSHAL